MGEGGFGHCQLVPFTRLEKRYLNIQEEVFPLSWIYRIDFHNSTVVIPKLDPDQLRFYIFNQL